MNSIHRAVGCMLVVTVATAVVADHHRVLAGSNAPAPTVRRELLGVLPEPGAFAPQDAPRKVFPKVDPKDEIPLPEGEGRDATKRVCGNCHSTNIWIKQRHTTEKWSSIIDNMLSKGMEASDDDLATVNDYLGKNLGPAPKDPTASSPQK